MAHIFIWVSPLHGEDPFHAARETLALALSEDDGPDPSPPTPEDRTEAQRYGLTLTSTSASTGELRFCVTGSDLDIDRLRRCLKRKA